jgi:hypothetical protein
VRCDVTADIFRSNSLFRKTDGLIPYLHKNIVENLFGTLRNKKVYQKYQREESMLLNFSYGETNF